MSLLPVDSINAITETIGVQLREPVAQALVADVEYRLREVIHDARKFMRHSRRLKLTPEHINQALRVRNIQIDLDQIINAPLPPVPLDVVFTAHWLAIEGVQPAIVQNPTPADIRSASSDTTQTISKTITEQSQASGVNVPLLVSSELQLYHDKITESILSPNEPIQALAINSLETDPGIQPLLPYFVQFMTQKITKHIRNLKVIESPLDDHHALRRFAAQLAAHICITYTATYPTLQPRVTKTLLRAFLDPLKPNATHYGAIFGLSQLGNEVVKMLIRPNVKAFTSECMAGLGSLRDMILDVLKHVAVEYEETEKAVLKTGNGGWTRPSLDALEKEFVDAFGEVYGRKVASQLDASLRDKEGDVGMDFGMESSNANGMDLDLDL
ncbi:DUF1546-domain-containing protein [Rhizoclosmatium globosum]|uniref:DUF1546-domain-containing protein n=1 Tax=Rhizoclosmatium globosum TaxID=329046 RepID=A0A1Y2CHS0_9FUNG|nr:DUF1546-domain-containing protein [Rhizoclosmatium globosum]|eukprot:ORY46579.1 DUF1546-domain-containing protein [Rhizoclosmatium globosum]